MTLAELLKNSNGQFGGAEKARAVRDDSAGEYGESLNPDGMSLASWLKAKGSDVAGGAGNLLVNLAQGFSPVGSSPEGNMTFQVPPMVTGLSDSLGRLVGTPNEPGNAWNISGVQEFDAPIQQDMNNVLLSTFGAQAFNPLRGRAGAAKAIAHDVRSDWDGNFGGFTAYAPDGKAAAYADVLNRGDGLEIANITSFPEYRGQGYAKSIVDQIRRDSIGSVRVSPMTEEGRGFFSKNYGVRDDGTLLSDNKPSIFGSAAATAGEQNGSRWTDDPAGSGAVTTLSKPRL